MASYGVPTSFGFMDRYAGMGVGGEERELRLERSRVGLESDRLSLENQRVQHERNKLGLESDRMALESQRIGLDETKYQDQRRRKGRSVFGRAWSDVEKDSDGTATAAGTALGYSNVTAEIKFLVKDGKLREAANLYRTRLIDPRDSFRAGWQELSTAAAENDKDAALRDCAFNMLERKFDETQVVMANGRETTIGGLFARDQYKDFLAEDLRRERFSPGFIARYDSDDQFTRDTFRGIADPVLNMYADRKSLFEASRMAGGTSDMPSLGTVSEFGTYLDRNFDDLRADLGDAGLSRLVQDAKDLRIKNGTYEDSFEFVRAFANNRKTDDADADMSLAVQDGIKAYDWIQKLAAGPDGSVSPDAARTMSKFARWAVESGVSDFDNDDVRRRFMELANLTATLSRLDVPVFSYASAAGAKFRKSVGQSLLAAQFNADLPRDNYARKLGDLVTRAIPLLTAGTTAANEQVAKADPRVGRGELAAVARATTGRPALDNALARMLGTFVDQAVADMSVNDGTETADALARAMADQGVRARWAQDVSATMSLTPDTARVVVDEFAREMSEGGGLRAGNLAGVLTRIAKMEPLNPAERRAKTEVERWLHAEEMGNTLYADRKAAAVEHILRTSPGATRQQAEAAAQSALQKDYDHFVAGHGRGTALDTLANTGVGFVQRRDPGTGYPVARLEDGKNVIVVPRGQMGKVEASLKEAYKGDDAAYRVALGGFVEEGSPTLRSAVPMIDARAMDLRKYSAAQLSVGNVMLPGIEPGLIETDRNAFYQLHGVWRQLYEAQIKGAGKHLSRDASNPEE